MTRVSDAQMNTILARANALASTVADRLPDDFLRQEELGCGSNNRVYRVRWNGKTCVLRVPRRNSDTIRAGNAKWEYIHTAIASVLDVAPTLHDAWFSRHADDTWPCGLYLVMDYYPSDLDDAINDPKHRTELLKRGDAVGQAVATSLERLATNHLFVYDLKPANVVLDLAGGPPRVRIIDFGREFCEWAGDAATKEYDASSPVIDMLCRRLADDEDGEQSPLAPVEDGTHDDVSTEQRLVHVLFATMLIQLAATTTRHIRSDRKTHRMDCATRRRVNVVAPLARKLLDSMQGRHKELVRHVLRADSVRSVLQHYHGRRSCGTRRTFRLASAPSTVA